MILNLELQYKGNYVHKNNLKVTQINNSWGSGQRHLDTFNVLH